MKKLIYILLLLLPLPLLAQLTTGVPFLSIAPDARGVAMGETGVATAPDANSLYWNAAKYVFAKDTAGISLSYAPWMRELDKGMNIGALNAFYRFSNRHAIAVGARFYTYGTIVIINENGQEAGEEKPKDFAIDVAYSYRFNPMWSGAVSLRYISSDAMAGVADAASGVAFDLAVYFNQHNTLFGRPVVWSAGLKIANLGPKLSYGEGLDNNYLPLNLHLGGAGMLALCENHGFAFTVELDKFLVPAVETSGNGVRSLPDESVFAGIGDSFSQDFASVAYAFGAEYTWRQCLHLRAGYHLRHKDWGDRRYFTCGVGADYANFQLDFAYRVPAGSDSPFKNSWGLSLGYRF